MSDIFVHPFRLMGTSLESQTQTPLPRDCALSIMTQKMLGIVIFKFIKDTCCALGYIIWNHCFNDNNMF